MSRKGIKIIDNKDGSMSALVEVKSSYDNLAKGSAHTYQTEASLLSIIFIPFLDIFSPEYY